MFGRCKHCEGMARTLASAVLTCDRQQKQVDQQDREISALKSRHTRLRTHLDQYEGVVHTYQVILAAGSPDFSVRADRVLTSELGTKLILQGKLVAFVPANKLFSVVADSNEEAQEGA